MRKIKFRGKRVDNGEWVYGGLATYGEHAFIIITKLQISESDNIYFSTTGIEVDPDTVGQYTGKKVKTGEVFQDDIGKSIDGLFLVAWDEEKAAFVMHFYDYPKETLYLEEMWDDAEIIGNLHDNPELLKE